MDIISKNIYKDINELSDLSLQKKLWLNENNDTGLISSYDEVMCRLFDDNGVDDFIDVTASKIGMPDELISKLKKLRSMLNTYQQKETDKEIINDKEWKLIADQAKIILSEWAKSKM